MMQEELKKDKVIQNKVRQNRVKKNAVRRRMELHENKEKLEEAFVPEPKAEMTRDEMIKNSGIREKNHYGKSAVKPPTQNGVAAPAEEKEAESGERPQQKLQKEETEKAVATSQLLSVDGLPAKDFTPNPKTAMTRDEMMKKCGIRGKNHCGKFAVKPPAQNMEHALAEDTQTFVTKSGVAESAGVKEAENSESSQEKPQKEEITDRKKNKKSKEKKKQNWAYDDKRKHGAERQKQMLLVDYIIKELIHQEGEIDSADHFHLPAQLVMTDIGSAASLLGQKLAKALVWVSVGIFAVFLLTMMTLFPVLCVITFLTSPLSYYTGIYEQEDEVKSNPQYIKNVVQEMYTDFYGQIDTFMDGDPNNEVWYKYGTYSNADDVIAVYLAQVSSIETDKEESNEEQEDTDYYPGYLLIDTKEERQLLEQVFREFNSIGYEKIKVTVEAEDGEEKQEYAQKMTVSCLTVVLWREEHEKDLSEEQRKLLEILLEQAETSPISGISGIGSFDGNAVPITELVIPEGVDEKLVYLAGFIKAEAGNQSEQGKIAVGYVILNRAGGSGGNVKGVLTAPYQFSCYIPYHTVEKYLSEYAAMTDAQRGRDACWRAAEAVYYGTAENPIGNMKFYCNPKACSVGEEEQWNRILAKNREDEIITIGDHVFCKNCW